MITLEASRVNRRCTILCSDTSLYLGKIGKLGFPSNTTISEDRTESRYMVEINRGLRYVEVSCDIVDSSSVIDPQVKRSRVIATLPITTDASLKGSVVHYKDIESTVPINKGAFNAIKFNVRANNGSKFICSVLLDLYIM